MSTLLGPPAKGPAPEATSEEFHDRHRDERDERRRKLRYVMDFYRSKEYVMKNSRMGTKHRVLEAIKLTAWANFRDYAADENGRPLDKTDLAQMTGLPTQRVSEACEQLEAEGCIRIEGRIHFVIDDPELELKRRTNGEPESTPYGKNEEKEKALAFWQKHDPDSFRRYQKADTKVKRATQVLLARQNQRRVLENEALKAYRDFCAQQEPQEPPKQREPVSRPVRETKSRPVRENTPDPSGKRNGASLFSSKAAKELATFRRKIP